MADAAPAAGPAKAKAMAKASKSNAIDGGSDSKKRFEVKKV